jgi:hypothetical protein
MPYPNALLQATPRNALLGNVADFLAQSYSPERTQQAQGVANFLALPQISRTLDRLSYGEPLTTGAGGIGGTTRFNNDALDAAMALAPTIGPAARLASKGAQLTGEGAMALGRAGERYAEKVVPQIMQRGGIGSEILSGMSNKTISPLDVYHGTPHKFDKFDASKIGTGEGAQVYGYGLYFAENPAVAQGYKDTLAYKSFDLQPEAEKLGLNLAAGTRGEFIRQVKANKPPEVLARQLQNANIAARDLPQEKLTELFRAYQDKGGGNLYKADLPDKQIAKMLDYDKHLSEQPLEVQNILLPYQKEIGSSFGTGEQTLKAIAFERRMKGLDDSPAAVAKQLQEMGIPGIKYLDQQSKNAGGWHLTPPDQTVRGKWMLKGSDYNSNGVFFDSQQEAQAALKQKLGAETRNFVVFPGEEKSMTILERNGKKFDNSALINK